jgi:hypothetical protein
MLNEPDYRAHAREFCRQHDFNNVDLIEAAMRAGAEHITAAATRLIANTCTSLQAARERANQPH